MKLSNQSKALIPSSLKSWYSYYGDIIRTANQERTKGRLVCVEGTEEKRLERAKSTNLGTYITNLFNKTKDNEIK